MVSSKCQWVRLDIGSKDITILNLHGLWQRGSKKQDTEERLEQSKRIYGFMSSLEGSKILAGDFNMVPNGKSISILEKDMVNLIKEYKVETTRSVHYKRGEKFADYIIVSKEIKVNDFKVLPDEVSDHLSLYLDFE
ncbi:MAG: endonuclease/exonuclease/phosphatase family protein [Minisyncoccia bacterium]